MPVGGRSSRVSWIPSQSCVFSSIFVQQITSSYLGGGFILTPVQSCDSSCITSDGSSAKTFPRVALKKNKNTEKIKLLVTRPRVILNRQCRREIGFKELKVSPPFPLVWSKCIFGTPPDSLMLYAARGYAPLWEGGGIASLMSGMRFFSIKSGQVRHSKGVAWGLKKRDQ